MRTLSLSSALRSEMADLEAAWRRGQELLKVDKEAGSAHQSLLYAGMAIYMAEGLERLRKGWILDRLDAEALTHLASRSKSPSGGK